MYYLGIDLGGTSATAGVVAESKKIVAKASEPVTAKNGICSVIDNIMRAAENAVKKAGIEFSDIAGIGIGTPGTITQETGTVDFAANLGFKNTPLAELVKQRIPHQRIFIQNDANAAALAEAHCGAAKDTKHSVTVTLGTGVGGGIVIDGKIYSGYTGKGAELGHMIIHKGGEPCTCGSRGCWEAYASVSALIRQTKKYMLEDRSSAMWDIVHGDLDSVDGLTSFDGMRAGDKTACKVTEQYFDDVSVGIINIVNILQPEVICIGGGISREGDTLLVPINQRVEKNVFARHSGWTTQIRAAKLGNDAGIIGAALLAM